MTPLLGTRSLVAQGDLVGLRDVVSLDGSQCLTQAFATCSSAAMRVISMQALRSAASAAT
jgi:hypothetical protein